jgi:hypothetical protein
MTGAYINHRNNKSLRDFHTQVLRVKARRAGSGGRIREFTERGLHEVTMHFQR